MVSKRRKLDLDCKEQKDILGKIKKREEGGVYLYIGIQ